MTDTNKINTKPKRPWRMVAPLAAVITAFLLWSVYWHAANSAVQTHAARERAQLAARGFSLACASENWGGYPVRFEFTCANPSINFPGGQTARSGALLAVAQAYNPRHVIALIDGPSSVTLPDGASYAVTHGRAVISVVARRGAAPQISAEIPSFNGAGIFTANTIQIHTRAAADNANDIAITVDGAVYYSPGKPPLVIDRAQLLSALGANRELTIGDLKFNQNGLKLWGKGTLALDASNRLAGRFDAQTNDLGGLLTVLDPHMELAEQDRATLKAVLGFLGKEARVSLVARDGEFYIGPLKVGELNPLY